MDVVADVIAGLALVLSGVAFLDGRRRAKKAEGDAARALRAAEKSAESAERSATAAERGLAIEEERSRYKPPWKIAQMGKGRFLLTNIGVEHVLDIDIRLGKGSILRAPSVRSDLQPGASLELPITFAASADRTIEVGWRRTPESDQIWWMSALPG